MGCCITTDKHIRQQNEINNNNRKNDFNSLTGDIYTKFTHRIKRATENSFLQEKERSEFAEEVYHIVDKDLKYIHYERKQFLINVIEDLKYFQVFENLVNLKVDTKSYFGNGQVKNNDQIRRVLDFVEVSYIEVRDVKNTYIKQFIDEKQLLQIKNPQMVDQWGYKYDSNSKKILTLPALFKYNKTSKLYQLEGDLCKQIRKYSLKTNFEKEIENLVSYFSNHLKEIHNNYKNLQYENQLFNDTKHHVDFDKEIHAIISIKQITISPQQTYEGPLHKEGLSVEGIMYSCVYIIEQDKELSEAFIRFYFDKSNIKSEIKKKFKYDVKFQSEYNDQNIELGQSCLKEDMIIIFPNCNVHKVCFKNTTNKVLVNHIDQPYTVNDYEFEFKASDKVNKIPYQEKRGMLDEEKDEYQKQIQDYNQPLTKYQSNQSLRSLQENHYYRQRTD